MRLLISAGEASGEMHGAALIAALRRLLPHHAKTGCAGDPGLECFGVGGERMRAAGCDTVIDAHQIAVVGIAEVARHLPRIYGEFRRLLREVDARRPDAAVLIDFPDFNLRLARELHRRGVPVVYYISPQLWAWREGRIRQIRQYVKKMLVIFPFEEQWYRERGVEAEFVGHPLGEVERPEVGRGEFARQYGLSPEKQWIALLPGSRRKEFAMHFRKLEETADVLGNEFDYVIPLAPSVHIETWTQQRPGTGGVYAQMTAASPGAQARVVFTSDARASLALSRAAVVASGTATVEAAMMGTPFVMVYRVSPLTWTLGRPLVKVPHFAMPNLIAGREVVPELVQSDFTAEKVVAELRKIIPDGPERERMLAGLAEVREKLRGSGMSAADRAAEAVLKAIG